MLLRVPTEDQAPVEPLAYSIPDAAQAIGIGRSTIYELNAAGRLPFVKVGRRSLILRSTLDAFLAGLTPDGGR